MKWLSANGRYGSCRCVDAKDFIVSKARDLDHTTTPDNPVIRRPIEFLRVAVMRVILSVLHPILSNHRGLCARYQDWLWSGAGRGFTFASPFIIPPLVNGPADANTDTANCEQDDGGDEPLFHRISLLCPL